MKSNYTIPPRPKPGRKPAVEEPESKRKQQNREAQRAFRSRKQQRQEEAEDTIKRLEDRIKELQQQRDSVVRELSQCRQYKDAFEELRAKYEEASKRERLWQARAKTAELATRPPTRQQDPWTYPVQHPPTTSNIFANLAPSLPQATSRSYDPPTPPSPLPIPKDGCGGCKANGECPCVDEYTTVPPSAPSKLTTTDIGLHDHGDRQVPTLSRNMSIESMLSPTTAHTTASTRPSSSRGLGAGHENSFLKAESSATSQMDWTDQEVDFTTTHPKPASSSFYGGSSSTGLTLLSASAPSSQAVLDNRAMPPPPFVPGTCDQCRANPEQKRFCEDLALRKAASEVSHARGHVGVAAAEEQRRARRVRTAPAFAANGYADGAGAGVGRGQMETRGQEELKLNCQDAYHFSKAVADSAPRERDLVAGRTESQVLFTEFVNSQPASRRGTVSWPRGAPAVAGGNGGDGTADMLDMDMHMGMGMGMRMGQREGERQGRNMSLAEYDVVDVLATWRKSFAGGRQGRLGTGFVNGDGEVESRDE